LTGDTFGDSFGAAVALSGDGTVLAVGAPAGQVPGSVFIFHCPGGEGVCESSPVSTLSVCCGFVGTNFGGLVALSADGSTLAVGSLTYAWLFVFPCS
jgi:hypothetical protein